MKPQPPQFRGSTLFDKRNGTLWALGAVALVALSKRLYTGEKDLGEMTEGIVLGMLMGGILEAIKDDKT
jgi:hypothetical protein